MKCAKSQHPKEGVECPLDVLLASQRPDLDYLISLAGLLHVEQRVVAPVWTAEPGVVPGLGAGQ